jgi:glutamyl/glutaminyl-tRNA synthetase
MEGAGELLEKLRERFDCLTDWSDDPVRAAIKETGKETGVKGKGLYMPLRCAVTGTSHGPDLISILVLRGREDVVVSIDAAGERISRMGR